MEENKNNFSNTTSQPLEDPNETASAPIKVPASSGRKIGTFILFGFSLLFFIIFFLSSIFTMSILLGNVDDLGKAIGAIFGIIFSLPAVIISAFPTLVLNILSVIFFNRIRKSEIAHPALYRAFHIISLVLLILAIVLGALDAVIFLR